jgi:hypothetical protein
VGAGVALGKRLLPSRLRVSSGVCAGDLRAEVSLRVETPPRRTVATGVRGSGSRFLDCTGCFKRVDFRCERDPFVFSSVVRVVSCGVAAGV